MPIEGFDYQRFAEDLSQQAGAVIPADFAEKDKQYIVSIVKNFCHMSGEALSNDTSVSFDASQASIITQFIGEWAFHKSVDLIRGHVPEQFRDSVLQKIAFTVFEIAKQCIINKFDQGNMIKMVEHHVKKTYDEALKDLFSKGVLNDRQYDAATKLSNIDDMAKEARQSTAAGRASDTKILKLAAFAMVLKKLPEDKVETILKKFDEGDAEILVQYLQMQDLEHKLDSSVASKTLSEMKMNLPKNTKITLPVVLTKMSKILKSADATRVQVLVDKERPLVRELVGCAMKKGDMPNSISPLVANVIYQHLEEKLNDN